MTEMVPPAGFACRMANRTASVKVIPADLQSLKAVTASPSSPGESWKTELPTVCLSSTNEAGSHFLSWASPKTYFRASSRLEKWRVIIEPPVNRLPNLTRQNSFRPLLTRYTPIPDGKSLILAFFISKSSHYLVTGCQ